MNTRLVMAAMLLGLTGCPTVTGADGGAGQDGGGGSGGGSGGGGGGGGTSGTGGGTTSDGGAAAAPEWVTLEARVAGRTGRDLRLAIKGKDRNKDAMQVWVRLLDSVGGPVVGLDLNRDGVADASEGPLLLEGSKWTLETVQATAVARGIFKDGLVVAQVGVRLVDATTLQSEEQVVSVIDQAVVPRGSPCDLLFVENRCEPGLGCRGNPAVCDEGLAPQVGRLAFFKSASGPTILIEGTEPEDDLATVRFQFQNSQGQPISIDSDGDGQPDLASFDQDALGQAVDGTWFIRLQAGVGLDDQVPKLVVTGLDVAGYIGGVGADAFTGGAGIDTVTFASFGAVIDVVMDGTASTTQSKVINTDVENLTCPTASACTVTGNSGANRIVGSSAADTINGGGGDDFIETSGGNDTVDCGDGSDILYYTAGTPVPTACEL